VKASWEIKKLGEVCEILDRLRKPITKRNRVSGPYPYYGASGILDHVEGYLFDEMLVLLGEDGAKWEPGAKSAFSIDGKTWVNNHAHVMRPNREILNDNWLIYFLNFSDLMPYVSGMTVPKLNQGSLREIQIPLPPLEEQKRIVSILDEAFEGLDRARENAEANLKSARELFEGALSQKTRGDAAIKLLGDICDVRDGTHDSPKYVDTGYPLATQKNIRLNGLSLENVKLVSAEDHQQISQRSKVDSGDILIAMIGANRGMSCIVETNEEFSIKNVGLVKRSLGINMQFLQFYLRSRDAAQFVKDATNGGAQPFIGLGKLRAFPIPVPDMTTQCEIANNLQSLSEKVEDLTNHCQKSLTNLEDLRHSLLQKAFAGELT
jgi:type I restriction enzyme, S subunit